MIQEKILLNHYKKIEIVNLKVFLFIYLLNKKVEILVNFDRKVLKVVANVIDFIVVDKLFVMDLKMV